MSADASQPAESEAGGSDDEPRILAALDDLLACLRRLVGPCVPPVGVGAFDVLYANAREVVVWYSPVRPEHQPGEVLIPTAWLASAWEALVGGEALDEASVVARCEGRAGGARWVQALLAQAPGVSVQAIQEAVDGPLVLAWSASAWQAALNRLQDASGEGAKVTAKTRAGRGRSRGTSET